MMKWRLPVGIVSTVLLLWGICPFAVGGIVNIGVIVPTLLGGVGLAAAIWHTRTTRILAYIFKGNKMVRTIATALLSVVGLLVLLFLSVSVVMVCNAVKQAPPDTAVTLVVPGAGIKEDRPSLMLYGRLQAAAAYLQENPTVPCVVSGGQGEDEICSEALVMRNYLIQMGISADRIYMEEQSENTYENMQYTKRVMAQHHLPMQTVIATQEFHQFRCAVFAERAGLQPVGTATCFTPPYLFLCFWVREFAGICRLWLLGY